MANPYEQLQRPAAAGATTAEVSEPRRHIREHYAAITAARGRHVTWPQITATMTELGIRASDGSVLGWRLVKSFYHAERYARGGKPKRRKPRAAAAPHVAAPAPAPEPTTTEAPATTSRRQDVLEPGPADPAPAAPAPEAADLRALLARRRPALSEPKPVTLGPADRRPHQERDDDA